MSSIFKAFCFFESRVTQILTKSSYFPAPSICHYYNCYIYICQPRDTILRIVHFCLGINLKLKFVITKIQTQLHKNTNTKFVLPQLPRLSQAVLLLSEVTSRVSRRGQRKGEPNGSHALKQQSRQSRQTRQGSKPNTNKHWIESK